MTTENSFELTDRHWDLESRLQWFRQHLSDAQSQEDTPSEEAVTPPGDEREEEVNLGPVEEQGNGDLDETQNGELDETRNGDLEEAASNDPEEPANNDHPSDATEIESPVALPKPGPQRTSRPAPSNPNIHRQIDLDYHERRCTICKHPDREAIEEAFLQWRRCWDLVREFKIHSRTSLYRHAHALGLFERRARNMRFALAAIIEEVECVRPSAEGIIHAIRAYSCLDDSGRWTEPPKCLIISRGDLPASLAEPGDPKQ